MNRPNQSHEPPPTTPVCPLSRMAFRFWRCSARGSLGRIERLENFKTNTNILAVAGPGSKYQVSGAVPAGFRAGFWHGLISPIAFIVSLFNSRVRIYETHNRGRSYEFGFIFGASVTMGGSISQTGHGFAVPGLRVWW
jgi:hypothetical protein